jgi:hypothetical protein
MKKIGFIILALVLALGAIGAGYAAWSQNFTISGTVGTGTYVLSIAQTPAASVSPVQTVATCSVGTVTSTGSGAGFSITIANGFPGLTYTIPYVVSNTGSIPAKVTGFTFTDGTGDPVAYTGGNTVTFSLKDSGSDTFTVNASMSGITTNDIIAATTGSVSGNLVVTIPADLATGNLANHSGSFTFVVNTAQQY